ncbi:M20/M25/M40 family metallo-hydrolase [Permianibacter sp. IMCC34836]|uniref:M20/M25/M40 family metallo-hydrolase n=1 Tax=Permianibacter fluminis TaxID=2738515 RepID=UPI00155631C9|nr:M20/M25/M40 family metallo-hydrolase [Permianibacter fluminis]NQD37377.1 M20/M25/M40 family metallo-hydrolase [Permianibacter fluminis]
MRTPISVVAAGLAALLTAVPTFAADALYSERELQTAAWIRDAAADGNKAYAILESLTTEVGPRMAGSEGDARAVAWAEAKFKELGFDKVWKEPVSFPSWQRGVERAEVLAPFPQHLVVTALGGSIATADGGLQAEVVAFDNLDALKAAAPETLAGKIAFVNKPMRAFRDGHDYGPTVAARGAGAVEAGKKGAVGLLIRSVGTDSDRLPHTGLMRYDDKVNKIPAAALSVPDADLLANMLKRGQPVKLKLEIGAKAGPTYTSYNVIGEISGTEKSSDYVLIGGHLDSWDLGTGAIDDGAGCAMTMAAAEFLNRNGLKPKRSIRVVLFANEEQGLFGGNQYHDAHVKELKNVHAAAEADFGQGPVYRLDSHVKPQALPLVKQMQQVLAPLGIEAGGNDNSDGPDLRAMNMAGIASFGLALDGIDYFDLHHTPNDTFDKIEQARLNQSVAAFATWAWLAANSPTDFGSMGDYLVGKAKAAQH